jgi:hypothetical protein
MQIKTTPEILQLVSSNPNKDSLLYFTYLILKRNTNKDIYLDSQALKKTFGDRNYTQLRNQLVELGIIEVFKNHRDKEYPYLTYKIRLPHSKKTWINYEVTDTKLIGRVEYILVNNYEKLTPMLKQVLRNIETLVITPELLSELKKDGKLLEDEVFFTNNNDFKPRIKQSPNTGRVYHTLTNLNKKYRKKLTSTHGNLVEIDAKNAQLVFLSQLCPNDINFRENVFDGVFYEKLADKMGVDISKKSDKDRFKEKFFKSTLCNENKVVVANNKYSNAFKSLYPIMFDFLIYTILDTTKANTLQKLEAEFFITNILKDVVKKEIFAIPIHDAIITTEKDVQAVNSIIAEHAMAFFERLISTSIERYTICSTPFDSALLIKKGREEKEIRRIKDNKCICSAKGEGVEQNKNNLKNQVTKEKITMAIQKIMGVGGKITTRKIKEISGVSTASVNKHYKAIWKDIEDAANKNDADVLEIQISDSEDSCELKKVETQSCENEILAEFLHLSEHYGFPKGIEDFYVKHILKNVFDSKEEMMHEININPILKDLLNKGQVA